MRDRAWDPDRRFPWPEIKHRWEQEWDMKKPVLLEKSPPDIVRAFEIERVFRPSYFIAMIRDPYAFCEGRRRRHKTAIELSAKFWVTCATYQLQNIKGLENVIYFRYEDFAEHPEWAKSQILSFMPELRDLDATKSFKVRSIQEGSAHKIHNLNQVKIDQLSARDIREINCVLRKNDDLMAFYGYQYLESNARQSLRHLKTTVRLAALKSIDITRKAGALIVNRRRQN
jgi:hypothetical protein